MSTLIPPVENAETAETAERRRRPIIKRAAFAKAFAFDLLVAGNAVSRRKAREALVIARRCL